MNNMETTPVRGHLLHRPAWLTPEVWPFETLGVASGETLLAVTETGSGPTLLFVHVGTWQFIWRDLALQLARDFRCVFFDAPGNGLSDGREVSLERASLAVTSVMNALELTDVTMVAHDLGGPAGFAAAAAMPQRIRALVAMNAFGWRPEGSALRGMIRLMGSRPIRAIDSVTAFLPRISSTNFGVGRNLDERERRTFVAGMDVRGRHAFHDYMRDASRCENLYRKVRAGLTGPLAGKPMLTIFGERNDPFAFQKEWKRLFPEARQVVVRQGNHFPMCDAPEFAANEIRSWYRECVDGN
jgi:haloalkane dehalogenase